MLNATVSLILTFLWGFGSQVDRRISGAHEGCVFALAVTEFGFISGGKDGFIKIWTWEFQV